MRVVSLLPAATEMVALLDRLDLLVGVSHECDYPAAVRNLPRVTHAPLFAGNLPSGEIDRRVRETLAAGGSLYELNAPLLRDLAPNVILTQQLCDVCAVGFGSVAALAHSLPTRPRLVNFEPRCLADILANVRELGDVLGESDRGHAAAGALAARVAAVERRVALATKRPRVFLVEWIEPLFSSGHWGPELVSLAGGQEIFNRRGEVSVRVSWPDVLAAQPEVILAACCGYSLERTRADLSLLRALPEWETLPAVRQGRVYAADGNAYFHRPGPRIVDSLELLATIIHPELFSAPLPAHSAVRV